MKDIQTNRSSLENLRAAVSVNGQMKMKKELQIEPKKAHISS